MSDKIWTVILAAGQSSRFNGIKALAKWEDSVLISHVIEMAKTFSKENFIVVTGAHSEKINSFLKHTHKIHNPDWEKGMGLSISLGVRQVLKMDADAEAILILCVDQPLVSQIHLERLLRKAKEDNICVLSSDGEIDSPPAVIPLSYFGDALSLTDDRGLKKSLDKYDRIIDPLSIKDIDTQADLDIIQTTQKTA